MAAPTAAPRPSASGSSASVLVVEDDLGIATQLVRGLTRGGYDVDHVTTVTVDLPRRAIGRAEGPACRRPVTIFSDSEDLLSKISSLCRACFGDQGSVSRILVD